MDIFIKIARIIVIMMIPMWIIALVTLYNNIEKQKIVIDCIDGDTFKINQEYFRLSYVNAPEKGEEGYEEASNFTCKAIGFNEFNITRHGTDIYGRTLAEVKIKDWGGTLNRDLVKLCLAKPFYKNTKDDLIILYYKNCYEEANNL